MEKQIQEEEEKRFYNLKLSLKVFFSNRTAVAGLIIFLGYVADALLMQFYPEIVGVRNPNTLIYNFINPVPQPPSAKYPLGTTYPGVNLLQAIMEAIRIDLGFSLLIVVSGALIGAVIGVLAAYVGGYLDEVLMRITDIFFSVPFLVLALAVGFVLGRSLNSMVIALIIVWWPIYARYSRSLTLSLRESMFIEAAKASGASNARIMFRHILPNTLPPILVQISLDLGSVVGIFATLAFIGFIPNANIPELGYLTSLGLNYIQSAPWTVIFPGLAITLFALSVNLMGDGLRDVIDPRRRS
ncbi:MULTISPECIES: ABC transporter permease [Metallosphaera]|uniref:Binding-protein-dependent transport systems inner membrane component n=3 Tax=Metallosphaera TaxID=41980 RepID=A4YIU1_METS5|nr:MULTISPECIES: ABC transporter permease [Metallosphaera]ABP96343.1 binding-protein-dependent transport systems inner membrane component [Metallosphaera sedula DSM 5348]AIM28326.1 binding-protein-dependent transport systems inner membrane component [Metallosphaera sedula]AKV75424.1 peptide ABC transporter permease [Metallosphaera sedula]AKV77668.1 peptide ABC transporter permease [Metallosphaera sedula]AKV79914.1 peptide ABC transporter permease [Metallosphaera sedula]